MNLSNDRNTMNCKPSRPRVWDRFMRFAAARRRRGRLSETAGTEFSAASRVGSPHTSATERGSALDDASREWRHLPLYLLIRLWALLINCFPIELNLASARLLGRLWWRLSPRHRRRALEHLRLALGTEYSTAGLERIARGSFEHFTQLYLVELVQMPRLVTVWSWARHIEFANLPAMLCELLTPRGVLMVTPHFGNYELIGLTMCRLGVPVTAIMRPLDNPRVNRFVVATRAAAGLTLIDKRGAAAQAAPLLAAGGVLGFIGDQDAGRKAVFVDFFGRKASTYKSMGLLAMQQRVPILVGAAHRIGTGFRYRMVLERVIRPEEWDLQADPLTWITQEISWGMERCVRRAPEQYLWLHRRWKHQPPAAESGPPAP